VRSRVSVLPPNVPWRAASVCASCHASTTRCWTERGGCAACGAGPRARSNVGKNLSGSPRVRTVALAHETDRRASACARDRLAAAALRNASRVRQAESPSPSSEPFPGFRRALSSAKYLNCPCTLAAIERYRALEPDLEPESSSGGWTSRRSSRRLALRGARLTPIRYRRRSPSLLNDRTDVWRIDRRLSDRPNRVWDALRFRRLWLRNRRFVVARPMSLRAWRAPDASKDEVIAWLCAETAGRPSVGA